MLNRKERTKTGKEEGKIAHLGDARPEGWSEKRRREEKQRQISSSSSSSSSSSYSSSSSDSSSFSHEHYGRKKRNQSARSNSSHHSHSHNSSNSCKQKNSKLQIESQLDEKIDKKSRFSIEKVSSRPIKSSLQPSSCQRLQSDSKKQPTKSTKDEIQPGATSMIEQPLKKEDESQLPYDTQFRRSSRSRSRDRIDPNTTKLSQPKQSKKLTKSLLSNLLIDQKRANNRYEEDKIQRAAARYRENFHAEVKPISMSTFLNNKNLQTKLDRIGTEEIDGEMRPVYKPYTCESCRAKFISEQILKQHVHTQHSGQ